MNSHAESVETADREEDPPGDHLPDHSEEHNSHNENDVSGNEETLPEGTTYSLHSKRLRIKQLQRIAGALGLARDTPASQTRKLIEGKLVEMDRQPSDVQVIIQGTNRDGNIYLVDETGIIKSIKVALKHVSDKPQPDGGARSVLRELDGDTHELRSALSEQISRVEALTIELRTAQHLLEEERSSGREKDAEIATLKNQLATEKQRVKRHWREKCEQLLAHEESLEEKEAEIALLKARILSLTSGTDEALTYVTPTTVNSVQQELTLQAPQEVSSSVTIAR